MCIYIHTHTHTYMKVKVAQSCLTLCDPTDYTVHGILQTGILEWVTNSRLQRTFPTQGSNPGLLHRRQNSLPAEPQGKPKNTGVGSLSRLQRIFLTQESNWGLLHCRQILYQLSHLGGPMYICVCVYLDKLTTSTVSPVPKKKNTQNLKTHIQTVLYTCIDIHSSTYLT